MRTTKPIRIALVLGLCCMLSSCVVRNEHVPEVPVDLKFRMNSRTNTEAGTGFEHAFSSVRVMAFHPDGTLDTQERLTGLDTSAEPAVNMDMTVRSGHKTFCVIANEPAAFTAALDAATKLSDIRNLDIPDYVTPAGPMAMTRTTTQYVSPFQTPDEPVNITLLRMVGKVRMKITKEPSNRYATKLISVQVRQAAAGTRFLDGNPIPAHEQTFKDLIIETFTDAVITDSDYRQMNPLYLCENYWGTGTPEDAVAGTATYLEVVISAEKTAGTWTTETYRLPLTGSFDNNGDPVYEVRRNTVADFELIVAGEGIKLTYNVIPWEDEDEYDKVPGEYDGNTTVKDWVLPSTVEYEHEIR